MSTSNKRAAEESESSDDDFGPAPLAAEDHHQQEPDAKPARKKIRKLEFEQVYLDNLPMGEQYEKSLMHRDIVTHIAVAKNTDYVITGSADGHVKFWKKMLTDIEFVKHFQAHLAPINALVVSPDGKMLVTTASDKMVKFFDVLCFDMSNMVQVPYTPESAAWICQRSGVTSGLYNRVAVADSASSAIRIYMADGTQATALVAEVQLHTHPVRCMSLNVATGAVVSIDGKGIIEYWDGDSLLPITKPDVHFDYKSETDLYDLAKSGTAPCSVCCAPAGDIFAVYAADKIIRVFDFKSGKIKRKYDESVASYQRQAAVNKSDVPSSTIDMGRKIAIERELDATPELLKQCTLTFDESGNFLVFGSLAGIKILNIVTNVVTRTLGSNESGERFLGAALYQGTPKVDMQYLLSVKGGKAQTKTVDEANDALKSDPTLYCTSLKRRRFYCFSRREPDESAETRDVLNERPTEEERVAATDTLDRSLAREAIIRTTRGDIHVKLFATECPKTIENFVTHARNGYYNNIIFHRVIKGFMLQTGDPKGDGTGGESIWGGEFEDEFVKTLKHDRPYTLSMANAGRNTNGSQFFITTVPTPWLDNKHTVFGRATKGFDVISEIENTKVNKYDKPLDEIKMLGIDIVN